MYGVVAVWLAGSLGGAPAWAESVLTEDVSRFDALLIPSQIERSFLGPIAYPPAGILPQEPLAEVQELPPFLKDADVTLHLRNYYLTREDFENDAIETWAQGGWLRVVSGRAWDVFSLGATAYGSYGLYTPEEKDGAMLLKPGQEDITVLGELYAQLNAFGHRARLGRQEYNMPFVNRQDNRMIPNTFEGYTLAATEHPKYQYGGGYVAEMKKRNTDEFVPMSEAAGATNGSPRGTVVGGARGKWSEAISLEVFDILTPDILNIVYSEAVSRWKVDDELAFKFSGQFIQQASVGEEYLSREADSTYAAGGMAEMSYSKAVGTLALTGNSSDEDLVSPYGTYAGYNSIIVNDYNRAGEYGLRTGLSYDFAGIGFDGFSAFGNYVWGFGAVDPATGEDVPNQNECDFTVDYRVMKSWLKGLSIRLRTALIEEEGGRNFEDYRAIVNYTL